ncbi:hypothetical protein NXH52_29125, partial [Klebsiella pneumoniae]|nr:hypothetical protein [Klebsiella pneumoniae]
EWVHVQLHQQKGMISLSPPTICNSAEKTLSCYQSKITRKFGCKRYIRFMYLYSLNKEMVDERWLMPSI